jgi:hypothetical protein
MCVCSILILSSDTFSIYNVDKWRVLVLLIGNKYCRIELKPFLDVWIVRCCNREQRLTRNSVIEILSSDIIISFVILFLFDIDRKVSLCLSNNKSVPYIFNFQCIDMRYAI